MPSQSNRENIRAVGLSLFFSGIGFLVIFILKKAAHVEMSKLHSSLIAFIITSLAITLLFPHVIKIPFGKVSIREFFLRLGVFPKRWYAYAALGVLCAVCTLGGMLAGSVLTGKYSFDITTISLSHAVFSLTPGIWEEILFRGVIMIVLMRMTQSLPKAFWIQIAIFALVHIKGLELLSFVDAVSVGIIAIAFTYSAVKTGSLLPGIIFHFLHDTFLFAVQLPDGVYEGFRDNAYFYAALWVGVLLSLRIIKRMSERFDIKNPGTPYTTDSPIAAPKHQKTPREKQQFRENISKRLLIFNSITYSAVILLDYKESDPVVLLCLGLYIIAGIFIFIRWNRFKHSFSYITHILNAFISFTSAYDSFTKGSHRVHYAFMGIGIAYLILAVVFYFKTKKTTEIEGSNVND